MRFDFPLFPDSASTLATEVDRLYFFALSITAFFSLLIAALIFYFFVKYRRKRDDDVGVPPGHSLWLEITWSAIPLAIVMFMFAWGAKVFVNSFQAPGDAVEYFATGKQWMWKFQHPEGAREINTLHVPLGQRIKLLMTSEDVIHSFFVPAFRVKRDVLPGRFTTVWFEATRTGRFHLFCAEYCGAEHSKMIGSVIVMEPDEYQAWLASAPSSGTPAQLGEAVFEQYICHTCHLDDGTGRGPSLVDIYGKPVLLADGRTLVRDDNYLRESILLSATKLVNGYQALMPTYQGQIDEARVMQLIAYIKSRGETPEESPTADAPAAAGTATGGAR